MTLLVMTLSSLRDREVCDCVKLGSPSGVSVDSLYDAVGDDAVEPGLHSRQKRQVATIHRQVVVVLWRLYQRDLQAEVAQGIQDQSSR